VLYVIGAVAAPLSPQFLDGVTAHLVELEARSRNGCRVFAPAALAGEYARRGVVAQVIDEIVREGAEALALAAAAHVAGDRVKVTADALVERNPLDQVHGTDDDPLHLAALCGVIIAFDENRSLAA
jgi:hypothetical protein